MGSPRPANGKYVSFRAGVPDVSSVLDMVTEGSKQEVRDLRRECGVGVRSGNAEPGGVGLRFT